MPLHPQARALLDAMKASQGPTTELTPENVRAASRARVAARRPYWQQVAKCQNTTVPGPKGEIPVRIYTPAISGQLPVLVFFHGGGFVTGGLDNCDPLCNILSESAGCTIVSVEYRLAPEHKFPAAPEDCLAVTQWVAMNARQLNVDGHHIGVGGESSGGNLAAAVTLAVRQRGLQLAFQLLLYPVTDATMEAPSYQENGEGYFLTRDRMAWFWTQYLNESDERTNPFISPLHADNLQGLPPAIVITAEFDPLRDEGEAYAAKLDRSGVPVICTRYPGMIHGFVGMADKLDLGRRAIAQLTAHIRAGFSGHIM